MKNRRFGSDAIIRVFSGVSVISLAVLAVVILVTAGNPVSQGGELFLLKLKGAEPDALIRIYGILMFTAFTSFSGVLVNLFRMKRRFDKIRLTPLFTGIVSVAGLIFMNIK